MSSIALSKHEFRISARILVWLTILLLFTLGSAIYSLTHHPSVVDTPLRPCKQCSQGCPCPRLAGEIRCGCPN